MKRNVNTPKQCRGCKNYTRMDYRCRLRVQGCKYTKYGKDHIKDCPCSKCLIKVMCREPCPQLMWNSDYSFYSSSS